jgi:hypothetical protein
MAVGPEPSRSIRTKTILATGTVEDEDEYWRAARSTRSRRQAETGESRRIEDGCRSSPAARERQRRRPGAAAGGQGGRRRRLRNEELT